MKKLLIVFWIAMTAASAQSRTCDLKQTEQQVREVMQKVMELRSQQDDRFLTFYVADEYSFPGESWVFKGQERSVEREGDMRSARQSGTSWHMEMRDLHLRAGCDMAWVAGIVFVQRLDPQGRPTLESQWRLTAIFERRKSGWRIVHQHSSLPVTDEKLWWKKVPVMEKP